MWPGAIAETHPDKAAYVMASTGQVLFRIQRPNDRVGRDAFIEAPDETLEERHAADPVVQREGRLHDPKSMRRSAGTWWVGSLRRTQ